MKIFCVGRNYVDHAKELNNEVPENPVIFMKPKSALLSNASHFIYPEFTNELHYEAELVFRICKNGRYISNNNALQYVDAVTVGIDFTARDIQTELKKKGLPWEIAKAWDGSALVGNWQTFDEDELNTGILFSLQKDGETVQQGNSSHMIFSVAKVINYISQYFSLNIGDLLFTGTPAGVGECMAG
ncbi:MAG: fumarylacetoacetate hydrolase family protein, partial [Bacteroidota bacterium]|nr:fumarylacetoacetate hydrolase family protein [Bacteroidota bacterium]